MRDTLVHYLSRYGVKIPDAQAAADQMVAALTAAKLDEKTVIETALAKYAAEAKKS